MAARKKKRRRRRAAKSGAERPSRLNALTGILLLPFCGAFTYTLIRLIGDLGAPDTPVYAALSQEAWWLVGGFALWLLLWAGMARPYRSYILAHELTHALWALFYGYRIHGIKVGADRGYVEMSDSNWVVTLAPYFFPFYTMLVATASVVTGLFMDLGPWRPFVTGMIGLTWGFHLTFTLAMVHRRQPDIVACGRLFAYPVIYVANVLGLCVFLVVVGSPTVENAVGYTRTALYWIWGWGAHLAAG